jgi:thiamine-monophosphate kinase
LRSGARAGDELWVSHPVGGGIGDARLALEVFRAQLALDAASLNAVRARMESPEPRVALGLQLRGVATSAIDLSDGLLGDLQHVLRRSGVGATVLADAVPRSATLAAQPALQRLCTLSGGDDYELLFTAASARRAAVMQAAATAGVAVTCIGGITAALGLRVLDAQGQAINVQAAGFDHFA